MLKIDNLKVSVGGKEILRGVNLEIGEGEIHAVMGPNGSGKSTLAYTMAGHPRYEITEGKINLDKVELNELAPSERAEKGLFLAMQYPVAIPGLSIQSFLWQIYKKRNEGNKTSVVEFRRWVSEQSKLLGLKEELLKRGLNDGFSGGEKKKLEILQLLVFAPKYIVLDEIDSGLDVDALKKIAKTVDRVARANNIGVLAITHYSRLLEYLKPDRIHVMDEGRVVESGGLELMEKVESHGYELEK